MEPESEEEVDVKNPIKRAEKEKEFRTVGKLKAIFTQDKDLYEAANKYSNTFKMVKNEHSRIKGLQIIDISLNARGPTED